MKHLHTSIALLCAIALMGCGSSTGKLQQGMDNGRTVCRSQPSGAADTATPQRRAD